MTMATYQMSIAGLVALKVARCSQGHRQRASPRRNGRLTWIRTGLERHMASTIANICRGRGSQPGQSAHVEGQVDMPSTMAKGTSTSQCSPADDTQPSPMALAQKWPMESRHFEQFGRNAWASQRRACGQGAANAGDGDMKDDGPQARASGSSPG